VTYIKKSDDLLCIQLHVILQIVVVYVIFLVIWIMLTFTQLGNNENPIAAFVVTSFLVTLAFYLLLLLLAAFLTAILARTTLGVLGKCAFVLESDGPL